MKITNLGKSQTSGVGRMSNELKSALAGMTINEALGKGTIDDIGTADGTFLVPHADPNISEWYAVVQNTGVRLSSGIMKLIEEGDDRMTNDDFLGTLTFTKGFSREKFLDGEVNENGDHVEWFRLGLPMEYNLDLKSKDAIKIGANPVAAKK